MRGHSGERVRKSQEHLEDRFSYQILYTFSVADNGNWLKFRVIVKNPASSYEVVIEADTTTSLDEFESEAIKKVKEKYNVEIKKPFDIEFEIMK